MKTVISLSSKTLTLAEFKRLVVGTRAGSSPVVRASTPDEEDEDGPAYFAEFSNASPVSTARLVALCKALKCETENLQVFPKAGKLVIAYFMN